MKRALIGIVICWSLLVIAEPALATCTTQSVFVDGKYIYCTTCCPSPGQCFTTCT